MTNKQWIKTLDEFERAVIVVNFGRSIPIHIQDNENFCKKQYTKWLEQETNEEKPFLIGE